MFDIVIVYCELPDLPKNHSGVFQTTCFRDAFDIWTISEGGFLTRTHVNKILSKNYSPKSGWEDRIIPESMEKGMFILEVVDLDLLLTSNIQLAYEISFENWKISKIKKIDFDK